MPFYKWIIENGKNSGLENSIFYNPNECKTDWDVNASGNKQMVCVIRHLAQLVGIASDIFGTIDTECKSIFQRTNNLMEKVRHCQDIVDNLNAKAVKVPVSSLSGAREPCSVYKSSHAAEDEPIFCTFPRPPEVDHLRQLANGPSPPAFIPSHKVAPETDGEISSPTKTHIYCQPLPVRNLYKYPHNNNTEKSTGTPNGMTTIQVPSTVVPIDVSGQPFNRMATFRRSLIHVDFFIRRKKKKDKRRNTVAEGDTKELKDVLHNIINEECQRAVMSTRTFEKNISTCDSDHHSKLQNENNRANRIVFEEKNNNSSDANIPSIQSFRDCTTREVSSEEKNKINAAKNETVKLESKSQPADLTKSAAINKRKLKSHIPISTISAAMNVAVEMRQMNGHNKTEDQSSSGNWSYSSDINSSDSENKTNSNEKNVYSTKDTDVNDAASPIPNGKANKHRFKAKSSKSEESNHNMAKECKEIEISSYTSSDNNATHDDETSNDTSAESDVFFISSDESDDSSDIIFENNYGSSLSVSTISDGSLNSLLSQTGTEMTSSSGTLTSIGLEPLPPPPPPPPAIVAATIKDDNEKVSQPVSLDNDCSIQKQVEKQPKSARNETSKSRTKQESSKKIKSQPKSSKSWKTEKTESLKHSTENPKNIFSTLINIKSRTKEQNKLKNSQNKVNVNKLQSQPHINMYGSSSPKNVKPLPLFLKENISPIKDSDPKNYLQSFSSNQTKLKTEIQPENKFKSEDEESYNQVNDDTSMYKAHSSMHDIKTSDMNKVEVPLKYAHKVTVTPIQRQTISERNNSLISCKKTLFKDNGVCNQQLTIENNNDFKYASNSGYSSDTSNSEFFFNEKTKLQNPMPLHSKKPKQAARVLLDPEGRVVHCTNSLDRRLYTIPSQNYANNMNASKANNWSTNREITKTEDRANVPYHNQIHYRQTSVNTTHRLNHPRVSANNRPNSIAVTPVERYNSKEQEIETTSYYKYPMSPQRNAIGNVHSRASLGTNLIRTPFPEPIYNQSHPTEIVNTNSFKKTATVIVPDPNISGLPVNEPMLTKHNIDLHSKRMEQLRIPQREGNNHIQPKDNFCQKSPQGQVNTDVIKPQQSTMSTEDLFAVIHNCKKRMNIKTDSDISLASSSRSNSPSYLRPTSSKGALAETGFLSPRNSSSFDSSRDRRSWADFRPTNSVTLERKSLASDRLGPTKPTSMHDFKMLLLQARSNSQGPGPRKSAVEMLKIPSPQDKAPRITSAPISPSPCSSVSYSVPNSPSSDLYLYNGHSTVPFKRNNRARSSLQSRYTMYPPIFEDCSEDSENTRDTVQHFSETPASDSDQINKNAPSQHSVNNISRENTVQNVRLWL
ncbi:unnamed protein product [Larinioides sclopetarius]|uniref:WASP family protein member n=1 Tax=Larinioides sclopetarius TaxID=280406 RepID=A0AAV1YRN1_9ARAC